MNNPPVKALAAESVSVEFTLFWITSVTALLMVEMVVPPVPDPVMVMLPVLLAPTVKAKVPVLLLLSVKLPVPVGALLTVKILAVVLLVSAVPPLFMFRLVMVKAPLAPVLYVTPLTLLPTVVRTVPPAPVPECVITPVMFIFVKVNVALLLLARMRSCAPLTVPPYSRVPLAELPMVRLPPVDDRVIGLFKV